MSIKHLVNGVEVPLETFHIEPPEGFSETEEGMRCEACGKSFVFFAPTPERGQEMADDVGREHGAACQKAD